MLRYFVYFNSNAKKVVATQTRSSAHGCIPFMCEALPSTNKKGFYQCDQCKRWISLDEIHKCMTRTCGYMRSDGTLCGYSGLPAEVKRHRKSHGTFRCPCGAAFSNETSFSVHRADKIVACGICDKKMPRSKFRQHLKRSHGFIHKEEKIAKNQDLECPVPGCTKRFLQAGSLLRHSRDCIQAAMPPKRSAPPSEILFVDATDSQPGME